MTTACASKQACARFARVVYALRASPQFFEQITNTSAKKNGHDYHKKLPKWHEIEQTSFFLKSS